MMRRWCFTCGCDIRVPALAVSFKPLVQSYRGAACKKNMEQKSRRKQKMEAMLKQRHNNGKQISQWVWHNEKHTMFPQIMTSCSKKWSSHGFRMFNNVHRMKRMQPEQARQSHHMRDTLILNWSQQQVINILCV